MRKKIVMILVLSLLLLGLPVAFATEIIPPAFALTKLTELGSRIGENQSVQQQAEGKALSMGVQSTVLEGDLTQAALPDIVISEGAAGTLQQGAIYGISLMNNADPMTFETEIQLEAEKITVSPAAYIKEKEDASSNQAEMVYFTLEKASTEEGAFLTLKNIKVKVPATAKPGEGYSISLVRLIPENENENGVLTAAVSMPDGEKRWIKPLYIAPCVSVGESKTKESTEKNPPESLSSAAALRSIASIVFTIGEGTYVVGEARRFLDAPPYIYQQRTMLPISAMAEALGIRYQWDNAEKVVYFFDATREVRIPLNLDIMTINGEGVPMATKPQIQNGRMMVPLASVTQAFGLIMGEDVIWDSGSKTVTIK